MWLLQAEIFKRGGPAQKQPSPFSEQGLSVQGLQAQDVFFCGWDYASKPLPPLASIFKPDPNFVLQDPSVIKISGNSLVTSITVQGVQKQQFEMPSYVAGTRSKVKHTGQAADAIRDLDERLAEYGHLSGGERIVVQLPLELAGAAGQQINDDVRNTLISGVKRSIQRHAGVADADAYMQANNIEIEVRAGTVSGPQFAASVLRLDLDAAGFDALKKGLAEYAVLPPETIALIHGAKTGQELAKILGANQGPVQFNQGYQKYPVIDRVFDLSRQVVVYNPFEFHVEVQADEIRVRLQHQPNDPSKISKRFEELNNQRVFLFSYDANGNEIRTQCKFVYSKSNGEASVCDNSGRPVPLSSFLAGSTERPVPVGSSIALSLEGVNIEYRLFKIGETRVPPVITKTIPKMPPNVPQFSGLLSSELSIQYGALDNTGPGFKDKDFDLVNRGMQSTPHSFPIKTGTQDQSVIGINEVHVGTYRVVMQEEGDDSFSIVLKNDQFDRLSSPGNRPKDDYGRIRVNDLLHQSKPPSRVDIKDPHVKHDSNSFYYEISDPLVMMVDISKPLSNFQSQGGEVKTAALQMFVDDFQARKWGSHFTVMLNGMPAPFISNVLNQLDQSGPVEQMVTIPIPPEYIDAIKSGKLTISINETTGKGDGYAIDALFLYINPDQAMLDKQAATEARSRTATPQNQPGRRR